MKIQYKALTIIAICLFSFKGLIAQDQLNDYQYLIVKDKFDCQKSPNLYQLNGLTQFLLKKQNFEVYLSSDEFPKALAENNCLALFVDVTQNNNMFKTKLKIVFSDCRNQVVFTTNEGVSREKEFKVSYNRALRSAMKTLQNFKHNYTKKDPNQELIKEEHKPVVKEETKTPVVNKKPERLPIEAKPAPKTIDKNIEVKSKPVLAKNEVLTAELIPGSVFNYKIKNNNNQTVYTALFSGKEEVYLVKGQDALIYKVNNKWVIAEYINSDLQVKALNIQF